MDDDHARGLLSQHRDRIEHELARLRRDDDGEHLAEDELEAGIAEQLREELEAIARAEERLSHGTYGLSIESGAPIPDARLELAEASGRRMHEQQRRVGHRLACVAAAVVPLLSRPAAVDVGHEGVAEAEIPCARVGAIARSGLPPRRCARPRERAGRSNGSFGSLRTLAERVSLGTLVTAADARGDALVAWRDEAGVTKLRERPAGGAFGPTRTLRPGGTRTAAMNLRGDRVLAWWSRGGVYARVRRHGEPWGPARLAAKAPNVTNAHVRAAVTAGGRVVLAWESADIGEDRPIILRAGLAQLVNGCWRAHALERSTHATVGLPETSPTQPVVDSAGRVYVAWTGTAGGGLAVQLARVAASGPRAATVLSAGVPGAALNDVAAGPGGALLVSWSVQRPASSVVYASLRRGGFAFAAPQQLTPDSASGFGVSRAAIAPSTGEAVVTWSHSLPDGGHAEASVNAP